MRLSALTLAACFATVLACRETSATEPVAAPPSAAAASAAPASAAPAAAEYSVRIVPGDAKAGEAGTSIVEVTPAAGFKMNLEFPSRAKNLACAGGTVAQAEVTPGEGDVTEQVLRFKVPFTAAAAGTLEINGLADFSVCNERACKLIRDEKLAWAVEVK